MPFERWFIVVRMRLRSLAGSRRADREAEEELAGHVARQIEANLAAGMEPGEARTAALRSFGGVAQHQEALRDARGLTLVSDGIRDIGYALRVFARRPAFAFAATAMLALGIGLATAMYAAVKGVFL